MVATLCRPKGNWRRRRGANGSECSSVAVAVSTVSEKRGRGEEDGCCWGWWCPWPGGVADNEDFVKGKGLVAAAAAALVVVGDMLGLISANRSAMVSDDKNADVALETDACCCTCETGSGNGVGSNGDGDGGGGCSSTF